MSQFIRSVLMQDEAQAADGTITRDLPINPLSHIILTLLSLNETTAIADKLSWWGLAQHITRVEVLFRGQAIWSCSLRDLAVITALLHKYQPVETQTLDTNNNTRSASFILPFGPALFDPDFCFPRTTRGELQLQLTTDVAITGSDGLALQVETIEMPDASPSRFLKGTVATKTPAAIQDEDLELPIGNDIMGILLWGTTVPAAALRTSTIGRLKLLLDNQDYNYAMTNWESLRVDMIARLGSDFYLQHIHGFVDAAAGQTDAQQPDSYNSILANYAYLDFDPNEDGNWLLETAGRSRVHLRITHDVADAMRAIPIEIIRV